MVLIYNGILLSHKKNQIVQFAEIWMDLGTVIRAKQFSCRSFICTFWTPANDFLFPFPALWFSVLISREAWECYVTVVEMWNAIHGHSFSNAPEITYNYTIHSQAYLRDLLTRWATSLSSRMSLWTWTHGWACGQWWLWTWILSPEE